MLEEGNSRGAQRKRRYSKAYREVWITIDLRYKVSIGNISSPPWCDNLHRKRCSDLLQSIFPALFGIGEVKFGLSDLFDSTGGTYHLDFW